MSKFDYINTNILDLYRIEYCNIDDSNSFIFSNGLIILRKLENN